MAENKEVETVVQRRKQPSTFIPNVVFAACMIVFIVFIFLQFGMRHVAPTDVSQNSGEAAPATAAKPLPN